MTTVSVVLMAAGALLAAVAAGELLARGWMRHRSLYCVFPPGGRLHLHIDREVFPELEPFVRFEVNREGERGEDVPRVGPGQRLYRILVAGGSQPEGYALDQATSWPGALQRVLQTPEHLRNLGAAHVHVGNISRSGVGSEALDLIFERVLPRYPRLDAVVILVGASDILRWLEQGAPPFPPSRSPTAEVFKCHPEGPFGWRPGEMALVEQARRLRQRWLRPVQVQENAGRWMGRARAMRARAKEIRTAMPDPAPMLDHFEAQLRKLLEKARAKADRVLVVGQPWFEKQYTAEEAAHMWHGGVGQAWREEITSYFSFDIVSRLMALMNERAFRVAKELGVERLDLMPILERSLAMYYDAFHATPAGARAVAAAVAAAILRPPIPLTTSTDRTGGDDEAGIRAMAARGLLVGGRVGSRAGRAGAARVSS